MDHAAARFHHRLVQIHPFQNGNGRHARELADLALLALGQQPFTWGQGSLSDVPAVRREYIDSLIEADHGDYRPLFAFVRR